MNNMIKGAVFDLDHTLFDRYATQKLCVKGFCKHFDVADGMTDEKFCDILEYADKRYNHLGWEIILEYLANQGVFKTVPTFEDYCAFIKENFHRYAVPFDFAKPMLEKLKEKGLKSGLITNGPSQLQRKKLEMLDLEKYFDEIIISGELGVDKPDLKPFEVMAERLNLKPSELVYVGDNPKNDVEPSRKAGYTPIWVMTTGYWLFPEIEVPEFCIKDVSLVPEVIEKLNKRSLA